MILLDANVILDVWDRDPVWYAWSRDQMRKLSTIEELAINPIVYAEVSARFATSASLDEKLQSLGVIFEIFLARPHFSPARPSCNIAVSMERRAMFSPTSLSGRTLPCWAVRSLPGIRVAI
jgi:predicted nucleic acid-binding protein